MRRVRDFVEAANLLAPIVGIAFDVPLDKTTWKIEYKPEATSQQKADVEALKDSYDPATPSIRETRKALFQDDADWQLVNDKMKNSTPDQLKTWVESIISNAPAARMFTMILNQMAQNK